MSKDNTKSYFRTRINNNSGEINREQVLCHHGLENVSFYHDATAIRFEDPTWTEIQACRDIFFLNQWLDNKSANYCIINLSKEFMDDGPATGKFIQAQCYTHPRNILTENTYYTVNLGINKPADFDLYGWHGHHGPDGNQYFFNKSILPKLK
jgi:hypothetical protein